MNGNVIKTITVRGTSEGLEKLTADVNKLATAQQNVAVVSEQSARRVLSLEDAWKRQTLKLDEAARAQANIARETKLADAALREGLATQQQYAQRLEQINQRYNTASRATQTFGQQTGLARHELINLSRQAQDVGVSLASGQSPFTVLVQQGSQIADVFLSSRASIGSFFSQAIGWAKTFAMSTAGVVTGITAIGGAALYMAHSFMSAQKEIDKALSGVGAASGTTRSGINRIAEGAAGSGMGVAETRASALEFVKTGKIYEENINIATNVTREFARAMGIDAADATKQLAAALVDPSKGALDLNKNLGFLDATTLKYIQTLQSQGRLQEAQSALMNALIPSLAKQADQVGLLTRAWQAADDAVTKYQASQNKEFRRTITRATGIDLGGFEPQERLGELRTDEAKLMQSRTPGLSAPQLKLVRDEIERIEKAIRDAAAATESMRFTQLTLEATAFGKSIDQTGTQIKQLQQGLAAIEQVQAARLNQGVGIDQGMERQAQMARQLLATLFEQQDVEQRKAQVIADNALAYQNVSASTAQQLVQLQAQLGVAQAVTGAAQIEAQHHATIVQLLGTANTLLVSEEQLRSAMANADKQREIAIATANTAAQQKLTTLQNEMALLKAVDGVQRDRIQSEQTLKKLLDDQVEPMLAQKIAAQELANLTEERAKQEYEVAKAAMETAQNTRLAAEAAEKAKESWGGWMDNAEGAASATADAAGAVQNSAQAAQQFAAASAQAAADWERIKAANEQVEFEMQYIPFGVRVVGEDPLGYSNPLYQKPGGQFSQYNPAGYTSTTGVGSAIGGSQTGQDQINQFMMTAFNAQLTQAMAAAGGNLGAAVGSVISGGNLFTGGATDTQKLTELNRYIELMSPEQQISSIQGLMGELSTAPQTLQTAEMTRQLGDRLAQLTRATEDNTSATSAMTDVLSPYYSSDPRRTHLGFRAFAGGGIMTQHGELPLRQYQGGGVATSAQVAVFGEGSTPEAYVPMPSGRIPVELKTPANQNQRPVNVTINVMGNADAGTVAALKQTSFQKAQQLRRMTG